VLARLARVFLAVLLLAAWHASLDHSVEHASGMHEESTLCGVLDGLTACAAKLQVSHGKHLAVSELFIVRSAVPRPADAPPFLSQGPPAA
jgi:hypothetical protein